MKKILEFLEQNGIKYESIAYGNPHYYNDGFTVQGITIKFDYELTESIPEDRKSVV